MLKSNPKIEHIDYILFYDNSNISIELMQTQDSAKIISQKSVKSIRSF